MEESFQFNFFQPTAAASEAHLHLQLSSSAAADTDAGQQAVAAEPLAAAEVGSNEAVKVI
jgi:hypothetical protein